jgi:predicted transposase YdaD
MGLRPTELPKLIQKEATVPITVDLEENPLFVEIFERYTQRGEQRGEQRANITMLSRLLKKRFGELPNWVNVRLEQATAPELERWSLTFLDVTRLEDVFREDE